MVRMDRICQTGHESLLNSLWGPFPVRFVQHLPLFGGPGLDRPPPGEASPCA